MWWLPAVAQCDRHNTWQMVVWEACQHDVLPQDKGSLSVAQTSRQSTAQPVLYQKGMYSKDILHGTSLHSLDHDNVSDCFVKPLIHRHFFPYIYYGCYCGKGWDDGSCKHSLLTVELRFDVIALCSVLRFSIKLKLLTCAEFVLPERHTQWHLKWVNKWISKWIDQMNTTRNRFFLFPILSTPSLYRTSPIYIGLMGCNAQSLNQSFVYWNSCHHGKTPPEVCITFSLIQLQRWNS